MPTNWKQLYAKKKQAEAKLLKIEPRLTNDSGIYVLTRDDESGLKFAYVGQAKHLLDRLVSHLLGYSQRIDISLKKRGFYDEKERPYGWRLDFIFTLESELDEYEQRYIGGYAKGGYQLYNRTSGSQGQGKVGINDGQSTKGYRDGLKQGYKNAIKDVKEFFDKYLTFEYKNTPDKYKKGWEIKEIYKRKYNEFKDLLESGGE